MSFTRIKPSTPPKSIEILKEMKDKILRYVHFSLSEHISDIFVEKAVERIPGDNGIRSFLQHLPGDKCRLSLFDLDVTIETGARIHRSFLVLWSPLEAPVRERRIYASNVDAFMRVLTAFAPLYLPLIEKEKFNEKNLLKMLGC